MTHRPKRGSWSYLWIGIFLCLFTTPCATETLRLQAESLQANATHITVSGNVQLSIGETSMQTETLRIDTASGNIIATEGITLSRGNQTFSVPEMHYHIDSQHARLTNVHIQISPHEAAQPIYLKTPLLENTPTQNIGHAGRITSCDLPTPHYYLHADYFELDPEKEIRLYNMWFYHPIGPIPFGLWSPMYIYALGKRQVVWNFPTIGRKNTPGWGWFMQNTIDYGHVRGMDASLYLDWFENKGIGIGLQQPWDMGWLYGKSYAYTFTESDTGVHNYRLGISPTAEWKIGPQTLRIGSDYQRSHGAKILSSGTEDIEKKYITVTLSEQDDIQQAMWEEESNFLQQYRRVSMGFFQELSSYRWLEWRGTQHYYFNRNQQLNHNTLIHQWRLPGQNQIKTTLVRDEDISLNKTYITNDRLIAQSNLHSILAPDMTLDVQISQLFDLDEDRTTQDSMSGHNNFLYKQPEIALNYRNTTALPLQWTQQLTIARYQEVQFDYGAQKIRTFPESRDYTWTPNTYISKTTLGNQWALPAGSVYLSAHADQYLFQTPGYSLFEGDALYTAGIDTGLATDIGGFLSSRSDYRSRFSPKENSSPFFAFDRATQSQNEITQTLTLYLISENHYHWRNSGGYNWILSRWHPYRTQLLANPIPEIRTTIQTGYNLQPMSFYEEENRYEPLAIFLGVSPSTQLSMEYLLVLDLNRIIKSNAIYVNRSTLSLGMRLGEDPEYEWHIRGQLAYNTMFQTGKFDPGRYDLQTLAIVKKDHCREFSFGYNKPLEEFQFQFTINAYPNDKVGLRKTRAAWKLEGILDANAQERL